ncbi:hypothetical protein C8R43DRAFT_184958 [Mycena crocata]|nr:hypothetical protein C8R43DRAFT_184958 [Mycena crocata]
MCSDLTPMAPSLSFDPNPTLGALQIGVLVSYVLFGVTTTQTYMYYTRFPNDTPKFKLMVAFIWFCELAHAICIGHTLYVVTISDYGHPERLVRTPESLSTAILFSGIVGPCVQAFFSFRIYVLSKKLYVPCVCWLLSFLRMVGSVSVFILALEMVSLASYEAQWGWLLTTILAVGAGVDLIIASTLVYLLSKKRDLGHKSTAATVDKLIKWTIETGVVTSAGGIIMLICFETMKDNFVWLAWFVVLARLFSNSVLASLNSRASLREMKEDVIGMTSSTVPAVSTIV